MMDDKDLSRPSPRVRLPFMKSPVVASSDHQDKVVQPDPGLRDKGEDDFVPHMVLGRGFPTYHGDFLGMPIFRKVRSCDITVMQPQADQSSNSFSLQMPASWSSSPICSSRQTTPSSHRPRKSQIRGRLLLMWVILRRCCLAYLNAPRIRDTDNRTGRYG